MDVASTFQRIRRYYDERPAMDAVRNDICVQIELGGSGLSERQRNITAQYQRDTLPAVVGLTSGLAVCEGLRRLGMPKRAWILVSLQFFAWPFMATRVNNDVCFLHDMMSERDGASAKWREIYRANLPADINKQSLADDVEDSFAF
eukprot:GEMP01014788.1.p1 GENE.GEMP01014788.1~~GEMP01014788.1.p1  ORF type:complete len:146 (+),score=41.08 GEMP01014788.1:102-539(+)